MYLSCALENRAELVAAHASQTSDTITRHASASALVHNILEEA